MSIEKLTVTAIEAQEFLHEVAQAEIDPSMLEPVLKPLCDLLEARAKALDALGAAQSTVSGELRLQGKAQGVRLAISFIEDIRRGVMP